MTASGAAGSGLAAHRCDVGRDIATSATDDDGKKTAAIGRRCDLERMMGIETRSTCFQSTTCTSIGA
jgi:hypothetical protein